MPRFKTSFILMLALMPHLPLQAELAAPEEPERLTYTDAVILGVVEGITEYLPVSSTGHLILTNHLLGLDDDTAILTDRAGLQVLVDSKGSESFARPTPGRLGTLVPFALCLLLIMKADWTSIFRRIISAENPSKNNPALSTAVQSAQAVAIAVAVLIYSKLVWLQPAEEASQVPFTLANAADAYVIIIQFGAIAAVVIIYWKRILSILMGMLGKDNDGLKLLRNLIVAFLPAAVLGLLFNDFIESRLFGINPVVFALIAGGILMLAVTRWHRLKHFSESIDEENKHSPDLHELSIGQCLIVGLLQCVAMWPGTSRSMMTIVGGYMVGLSPVRAAEFSFLLGLITLTAASAYKTVEVGPLILQTVPIGPILAGIVVAAVSAALAVKWLVSFLNKHGLALFAWYRIALAAAVFMFLS